MIVKTGANYQNDGGYIEASKTGITITTTIDGDQYEFKSDSDNIASLYKIMVGMAEGLPRLAMIGLVPDRYSDGFLPAGYNIGSTPVEMYAAPNISVFVTIGADTGVTNPVLAEGSHNAVIQKVTATSARIFANGPDAVAIIKEGDNGTI